MEIAITRPAYRDPAVLRCISRALKPEPQHARRVRILYLEPGLARARSIWMFTMLRDDSFEPELAGMRENGGAVAFEVLIVPHTAGGLASTFASLVSRSSTARGRQSSPSSSSRSKAYRLPCAGRDARFNSAWPLRRPAGTPLHARKMASQEQHGKGRSSIVHAFADYPIAFHIVPLGFEPNLTLARGELLDDAKAAFRSEYDKCMLLD